MAEKIEASICTRGPALLWWASPFGTITVTSHPCGWKIVHNQGELHQEGDIMFHIFGYAAIAVAGGAVGYWLRDRALEAKSKQEVEKEVRQEPASPKSNDQTEQSPPKKK